MCQISKENINFPGSYEQKEFEKGNKSKWLLRAGKKSENYGIFLHDKNNMTIKGAKIQAKISISGGEKGICSLGVNHIQLTNYVKLVHQILLTDYSSFS